jgi:hypothetical protein
MGDVFDNEHPPVAVDDRHGRVTHDPLLWGDDGEIFDEFVIGAVLLPGDPHPT